VFEVDSGQSVKMTVVSSSLSHLCTAVFVKQGVLIVKTPKALRKPVEASGGWKTLLSPPGTGRMVR